VQEPEGGIDTTLAAAFGITFLAQLATPSTRKFRLMSFNPLPTTLSSIFTCLSSMFSVLFPALKRCWGRVFERTLVDGFRGGEGITWLVRTRIQGCSGGCGEFGRWLRRVFFGRRWPRS
jgi:hypothetical protein